MRIVMARPTRRRNNSQENEENQIENRPIGVSTKRVLRNLMIMVPSFYMILYSVSSITYAILGKIFSGRSPFDFQKCCLNGAEYKANGISIIVSYLLSTFLFLMVTIVRLWDHIATITIFHILLTALVMLKFPLNWEWWVAIAIGIFSSILLGETTAYCLRQKSSKKIATLDSSSPATVS